MQPNLQVNQLIDSLNGEPLAVSPGYWQTVEGEVSTLAGSMTGTEMERRRAAVSARLLSANGAPLSGQPANLNNSSSTPPGSAAHLQLSGPMFSRDVLWFRGVNHLTAELTAADSNPNIIGVILEVNSGGGIVTAGQMLAATIAGMSKPVVVLTHFMASAAIMGTVGASAIVASSAGAEVGSIGTMVTVDKIMSNVYKNRYHVIYADKSTNKNHSHRAALDGNYGPLTKKINQVNEMFLASVRANRPLKGDVKDTLSGSMFLATDAKRRGLIDDIGGLKKAIAWLAKARTTKQRTVTKASATKAAPAAAVPAYKLTPMHLKMEARKQKENARQNSKGAYLNSPINQRVADRLKGKK